MTTTIVPRGPRTARLLVLPLIATAALGLTACGGDSAQTTATKAADGTAQQGYGGADGGRGGRGGGFGAQTEEERAELQACLKKQGVTLPTRGTDGPGGAPGTRTDGVPPAGDGGTGGPPAGRGGGLPGAGAGGRARGMGGMSSTDREKLQAALKSCGVEAPAVGGRRQGGARPDVNDAAYRKSIEAYTACVRKNGFDLPDPDFSGDGPIFDPKEVDQTDAAFRTASAACRSTLRSGRSSDGPGGTSGRSGSSSSSDGTTS